VWVGKKRFFKRNTPIKEVHFLSIVENNRNVFDP
jgi:hypothetical protein